MALFNFDNITTFEWGALYWDELEVSVGIEAFKTLSINQEAALLKMIQALQTEYDALDEEEMAMYGSQMFDTRERTIEALKRQQRYAVVLSIFSFYEGRLKSICSQIHDEFKFKISYNDFGSGADLIKYWTYLVKVYEIDKGTVSPLFDPIDRQRKVRNIIAHQDGIVSSGNKKDVTLVAGLEINEIYGERKLEIVDTVYLVYLLDKLELFFKKLLHAIDERYKVLKAN